MNVMIFRNGRSSFGLALVFLCLPLIIQNRFSELKEYSDIATVLGYVIAVLGFIGVYWQLDAQRKKDKMELVLKLSSDFYSNNSFMNVFELLDRDDITGVNQDFHNLIRKGEIDGLKEIHLTAYMNFFNSLAILVEDRIVDLSDVMKLFRYQLEKTFASVEMINYIERYGFDRVKLILPSQFFFYGTLRDSTKRSRIAELKDFHSNMSNNRSCNLEGFTMETQHIDGVEYKALVKSTHGEGVKGNLVSVLPKVNWHSLFEALDRYEEVETCYTRSIVEINGTGKYAWVYLKKA